MLSLRLPRLLSAVVVVSLALAGACASGPGGGPGEGSGGGGPGGGMGGRRGGPGGGMAQMGAMVNEDIPRDAATLALRFRNELALSDSQITAFTGIKSKLDAQAAPLRKQLDTLAVDPRANTSDNADQRAANMAKIRARADIIRTLRDQVQDVRASVLLALNDRQRTQMQVIEDAMKEDARPVMGGPGGGMGGGGMGGGRRGGGGRPPI